VRVFRVKIIMNLTALCVVDCFHLCLYYHMQCQSISIISFTFFTGDIFFLSKNNSTNKIVLLLLLQLGYFQLLFNWPNISGVTLE